MKAQPSHLSTEDIFLMIGLDDSHIYMFLFSNTTNLHENRACTFDQDQDLLPGRAVKGICPFALFSLLCRSPAPPTSATVNPDSERQCFSGVFCYFCQSSFHHTYSPLSPLFLIDYVCSDKLRFPQFRYVQTAFIDVKLRGEGGWKPIDQNNSHFLPCTHVKGCQVHCADQ